MRDLSRRCALLVAPALLALAVPAGAANTPATPVGGPLLAGTGVVVNAGPGVPPLPAHLLADGWLVADLDTGAVLAARDPHGLFPPASTEKVLTALTLIPRLSPEQTYVASAADVDVDGSRVGLVAGQPYTVRQLFTSMLVVSGNDSANALASANGGAALTLAEMQARARSLQADDTVVGTVSGLDAPGQHTSPYDLALIARAALALPDFRRYVATERSFMPKPGGGEFEIDSHNPLLGRFAGTFGVKNGYTTHDLATYIGAARRGGHTLLVTLMHAYPVFGPTARALLRWGFAADGLVTPVGQLVGPLAPRVAGLQSATRSAALSAPAPRRPAPTDRLLLEALGSALAAVAVLRARVRVRRRRRRRLRGSF